MYKKQRVVEKRGVIIVNIHGCLLPLETEGSFKVRLDWFKHNLKRLSSIVTKYKLNIIIVDDITGTGACSDEEHVDIMLNIGYTDGIRLNNVRKDNLPMYLRNSYLDNIITNIVVMCNADYADICMNNVATYVKCNGIISNTIFKDIDNVFKTKE